jgi:hypothetical protein
MMKIELRVIFIFKMAADKIGKISMFSNFNENWYLGLFWSEELIGNDENCIQGHFHDATVSKMDANKIDKFLMVSDFNENWYLGVFWSEEFVGNDEICIQGHFYEATIFKMAANKIVKLSMVTDFNENWYLGVFWSEELAGALNSDMGVVWGLLCLHPNTINPSYYYYSSSSFFRQKFVRHISRRLLNGNQWNFTGMLSTMSRSADYFRNFENGRHCHGNGQNAKNWKTQKWS